MQINLSFSLAKNFGKSDKYVLSFEILVQEEFLNDCLNEVEALLLQTCSDMCIVRIKVCRVSTHEKNIKNYVKTETQKSR